MKPTRQLHDLGQSLWPDNITGDLLDNGTLHRYIEDFSITGLTSNPTIFDGAIGGGGAYDAGIREKVRAGRRASLRQFLETVAAPHCRQERHIGRPPMTQPQGTDLPHVAPARSAVSLTGRPQWQALLHHSGQFGGRHPRDLFAADPERGERLHAEAAGPYLDYSKQRIKDKSLRQLREPRA